MLGYNFQKRFLNSKLQPITTSFKKEISILSHIAKGYRPVNICKAVYSSQGWVKKTIFFRKIMIIYSIFLIKNSKLKCMKHAVLRNQKIIFLVKEFLEFCENLRDCKFFALWLKILISSWK